MPVYGRCTFVFVCSMSSIVQIELVGCVIGDARKLRPAVGQHAQKTNPMVVEERHDAVVQEVRRGNRVVLSDIQ